MSKIVKAHIAVLFANIIYGANYSIAKQVMPQYIKPFGFILIRVTIAAALFFICERILVKEKVKNEDLIKLFLCALFGVAINQLLFFKGLSLTSPINSGLMMISNPVFVLLLAALIIRERIAWVRIAGICLGIAGCLILLLFSNKINKANSSTLGDLLVLINSFSFALYLVLVKPLMKIYHPITIMKWVFLLGSVIVIPFGFSEMQAINWSSFSSGIWWCTGFVIIGTTFFAYLFNTLGLQVLSPSQVSIYIYLQPLLAAIFAMLSGQDVPNYLHFISALLIFSGVYLTSRPINKSIQQA